MMSVKRYFGIAVLFLMFDESWADSCYISYGNLNQDAGIEYKHQSFNCAGFQTEMTRLFATSEFDDKLKNLDDKTDRVSKQLKDLRENVLNEAARATSETWGEAATAAEAVKDTSEMLLRCLSVIRTPKDSRKVFKCLEEVQEADESIKEFIEQTARADTQRILLNASKNLETKLNELMVKWNEQRQVAAGYRDQFLEMCDILKSKCVQGTTTRTEIRLF